MKRPHRMLLSMQEIMTHRFFSITVWAYLLSVVLAGLAFWLLPTSSYLHCWSLDGAASIRAFTEDSGMFVSVDEGNNRILYYRLDLNDGSLMRLNNEPLLNNSRQTKSRYNLHHTLYASAPSTFELIDGINGQRSNLLIDDKFIFIANGYVGGMSRVSAEVALTDTGKSAISQDHHWLILLSKRYGFAYFLTNWLESTFNWRPTFLTNSSNDVVVILDLETNTLFKRDVETHLKPEFVIHPSSIGFAVIDCSPNILSKPLTATINRSHISWYSLPPGTGRHSLMQWGMIMTVALVPLIWSWNRRKRESLPPPRQ